MIDPAAILVDVLSNDAGISAILSGGVFAYRIPPDAVTPLALVMVPAAMPAAAPTFEWWTYMATIDIQTDSPQSSLTVSDLVSQAVYKVVGNYPTGVVADCQVGSIAAITDGSWTPTRFRQVVTVDMTARPVTVNSAARRTFEGG
jgi:hypothetical protein